MLRQSVAFVVPLSSSSGAVVPVACVVESCSFVGLFSPACLVLLMCPFRCPCSFAISCCCGCLPARCACLSCWHRARLFLLCARFACSVRAFLSSRRSLARRVSSALSCRGLRVSALCAVMPVLFAARALALKSLIQLAVWLLPVVCVFLCLARFWRVFPFPTWCFLAVCLFFVLVATFALCLDAACFACSFSCVACFSFRLPRCRSAALDAALFSVFDVRVSWCACVILFAGVRVPFLCWTRLHFALFQHLGSFGPALPVSLRVALRTCLFACFFPWRGCAGRPFFLCLGGGVVRVAFLAVSCGVAVQGVWMCFFVALPRRVRARARGGAS
ncbi:hypothetical protein TRVL_10355 [Trypanosoma vivax]|nr:hypothetical protein TRVL_10355 [Trypanosoma vivax]